jgi:hypothetical protein
MAKALAILNEALWESGGKQARRLVGRDPPAVHEEKHDEYIQEEGQSREFL